MVYHRVCRLAWALLAFVVVTTGHGVHADDLCSIVPESYASAKDAYPQFTSALNELEKHSIATWYSDRNGDYAAAMRQLVNKCPESSRLNVVVYGLPNKDCEAGYSNSGGTVKTTADYERFLTTLTSIVGSRKVLYVLEPDAVGLLAKAGGCGEQSGYHENLQTAIRLLSVNPNADIYLDVGYWTLQWPDSTAQVANTVKTLIGAGRVKGITLNTSNYRSNTELLNLCWTFQTAMGSTTYRCVVDTSRNFVAPTSTEWCNVKTAGIGSPPTASTGLWNIDYFLWIKVPGESDGTCNDNIHTIDAIVGPVAGAFFADSFTRLWNQGYFVHTLGLPSIRATACTTSTGWCGNSEVGASCCPNGEYCQPWNPSYYQCRVAPLRCGVQQVGVDFYGDDLTIVYGILPEQCCDRCADTVDCRAYTFVNYNSDGRSACYLKRGTSGKRPGVTGAVSAEVLAPKTAACTTAVGGYCGNSYSGAQCCPSGTYCQPWNSYYYRCIPTPPQCPQQHTDVDFYGNDIGAAVLNLSPADCCATCIATNDCKAYTFVNGGTPACYLKSSMSGKRATAGAVSGVVA